MDGSFELVEAEYDMDGSFELVEAEYDLNGSFEPVDAEYDQDGSLELVEEEYYLDGLFELVEAEYDLDGSLFTGAVIHGGQFSISKNSLNQFPKLAVQEAKVESSLKRYKRSKVLDPDSD